MIAEHIDELARHKAAHYTYVEEVDVSELVLLRESDGEACRKEGRPTELPAPSS